MALRARHLLLTLALLSCGAWSQSPEAAITRRGFEYRPFQQVPWGEKLSAPERLSWVEAGSMKYAIDSGAAIPLGQEREFIRAYLLKHAHRHVGLIAELSHGAPPSFEPVLANPTIGRFSLRSEQPPIVQYQAMYASVKVLTQAYDVHCRFTLIEHYGAMYLVYRQQHDLAPAQSVEPRCNFS